MSDSAQIVVDIEVSVERASELASAVRAWLVREQIVEQAQSDSVLSGRGHRPGVNYRAALKTDEGTFLHLAINGVEITVGRRVFDAGQNGIELRYDACGVAFEPGDSWFDAVGEWFNGDNLASFPCPLCGQHALLSEWRGRRPWGFGNLGIQFWNWPPLSDSFIDAISRKIGHRTIVVWQHL